VRAFGNLALAAFVAQLAHRLHQQKMPNIPGWQ
jgi:hypothetical protein